MNREQYIRDLEVMIAADQQHLVTAVDKGQRTEAHRFVDSIIENQRELEDMRAAGRRLTTLRTEGDGT